MHDLADTLDLVRDAVIGCELDQLGPLTTEMERLLANADHLTESELSEIRTKAQRNTAMLAAALQGIRAAQRRLNELREASTGHRTYGPGGQRSRVTNLASTLRQRI